MEWLFSWEVTSWVVGFLVAIAFGILALDDFKPAKSCFLLAAADAIGGIAMMGAKSTWPTWITSIVVVGACALIGFLLLQSFRYVNRKQESKEAKKPDLIGEIEQSLVLDATVDGKRLASVFLILGIRNQGEPSIADNFRITVETNEKRIFTVFPTDLPPMMHRKDGDTIKFQKGDAIYDRTAITPILKGAKVTGWIRADFPELTATDFNIPGATFTVFFRDVYLNEYKTSVTQKLPFNANDPMARFPGVEQRFIPERKQRKH